MINKKKTDKFKIEIQNLLSTKTFAMANLSITH